MPSATRAELPDPWRRFLADVDGMLPLRVQLHCLGGFVLAVRHRLPRTTSDVDDIEVVPRDAMETLQRIAGRTSPLARKDRLYFQHVGVPVDREDIAYLARTVPPRADVLRQRYREELRSIIIGDPEVHDRTLDMWIEAYMHAR